MSWEGISYTPTPTAERFHMDNSFIRGIKGPIGCVAPETLIVTEQGLVRIDEIDRPMRVLSWSEKNSRFELSLASGAFPKGEDYLYRISTPRGEFAAAGHHRVFCADHKYRRVEDLVQGQSLSQCSQFQFDSSRVQRQLALLPSAQNYFEIYEGYQSSCVFGSRRYGQQPPTVQDIDRLTSQRRAGAHTLSRCFGPSDDACGDGPWVREQSRIRQGLLSALSNTYDFVRHSLRRMSGAAGSSPSVFSRLFSEKGQSFSRARLTSERHQPGLSVDLFCRPYSRSVSDLTIVSIKREKVKRIYYDIQVFDTNNYVTSDGTIHHNSGKSVACCFELFLRACKTPPCSDGVRRSRWAIIRNTYPELKSTTLKTWQEWFPPPEQGGPCKVKHDYPINGMLTMGIGDGTTIEAEILFLALDRPEDSKKLLSLELTGAWMNEARELHRQVLVDVKSRCRRFPSKKMIEHNFTQDQLDAAEREDRCLYWSGVWMDTNPPDDDHWWYELAETEKPNGHKFFNQPGALIYNAADGSYSKNPDAENVQNHGAGYGYWLDQLPGNTREWIRVMIEGEYGTISTGKPVYGSLFRDSLHVSSEPLEPMRGLPLYAGFDFGLDPACILGQQALDGQVRILMELVSNGMGLRQFVEDTVKPTLVNHFPDMQIFATGDPAGTQRSQVDETSCIAELNRLGIPTKPAVSNKLTTRLEAVSMFLRRNVGDARPAFIMDPSCSMLRKGFNGKYCFERVNVSGSDTRFKDQPRKDAYSHPHDALQYFCMGLDEAAGSVLRQDKRGRPAVQTGDAGGGWRAFTCG